MANLAYLGSYIKKLNETLLDGAEISKNSVDGLFKHRSEFDLEKVFKAIDISGNGTLQSGEFEDLLALTSLFDNMDKDRSGGLSDDEINSYFTNNENIDINMTTELADGKVTITEFIIAMMKEIDVAGSKKTRIDVVKESFGPYREYQKAKAGKGKISKETIKKVYAGVSASIDVDKLLGNKDGLTIEEDRKLLALLRYFMAMDKDRSDSISAKEIRNFTTEAKLAANADELVASMDKNNDSQVSFTEFYKAMEAVY